MEILTHYTLTDLTLEMKLNVTGISLPTVVLMLMCVSQFHVLVDYCHIALPHDCIDIHVFSDSLQVYTSLIMGNRSSCQ